MAVDAQGRKVRRHSGEGTGAVSLILLIGAMATILVSFYLFAYHENWLFLLGIGVGHREAIAEYIEEEIGHQEWILNDIRACGGDAEAVRHGQPALPTELMVAYVYDRISRHNPASFFGMVNVLEGTSIALATQAAGVLQDKLDLPAKAFSYLTSHGSLDLEHIEFFKRLMNRLDNEDDKAAVVHTARVVYRLYGDIFRSLPAAEHDHALA